jgi:hypothetical protein
MAISNAAHQDNSNNAPQQMQSVAADNLRYIRDTIDAAQTFTLVPGRGCLFVGLTGLAAAGLESLPGLAGEWLPIWLAAAVIAVTTGIYEMAEKARREGISLRRTAAMRFCMTLAPAFFVGAILTVALMNDVPRDVIAGVWLLTYGAGLVACGVYSLPIVYIAGGAFMGFGVVALSAPPSWAVFILALGFGGIHLALGYFVMRRHGG